MFNNIDFTQLTDSELDIVNEIQDLCVEFLTSKYDKNKNIEILNNINSLKQQVRCLQSDKSEIKLSTPESRKRVVDNFIKLGIKLGYAYGRTLKIHAFDLHTGNLIGTFESGQEASEHLNIPLESVNNCLSKKTKSAYDKYYFAYDESSIIEQNYFILDKIERVLSKNRSTNPVPVESYNRLGEVIKKYDRITDVEKDGFCRTLVSKVVCGERQTHKGLYWRKQKINKGDEQA